MSEGPRRCQTRHTPKHALPKSGLLGNTSGSRKARYVVGGAALLGMSGVGLGSLASNALLSTTASTTAASLAAGTITITQSGTFSTDLAATAMMPGDAQHTVLTVNNTGQASRISASGSWGSATNSFTNNLTFQATTVSAANSTCAAANFSLTATNAVLTSNVATITTSAAPNLIVGTDVTLSGFSNAAYNGTFTVTAVDNTAKTFSFAKTNANIATASASGTVAVKEIATSSSPFTIFGSSSTGQQTGDQAYTANSTQYYCFRLALPSTVTDNTGQTNSLTVTLSAEQTKNN